MNSMHTSILALVLSGMCLPAQEIHDLEGVGGKGQKRPNIVFLLADDQSYDSLGCYGNPDVKTPQIDDLAAQGMVFDNHYVATAICMASRASIMTGLFEFRHGCNFGHGSLMKEHWAKSYPVLLRAAGYRTAIAGKIGFKVSGKPGGKGALPEADFDAWGAGPGQTSFVTAKNKSMKSYAAEFPHATRAYGAFGRDFIAESVKLGQPFCLSISFKAPHRPATPDPKFDEVYADKQFRKLPNYGREHGQNLSLQSRQGRQYERFHSWSYSDRYDAVVAIYHQQIYAIDVAVGMIRKALVDQGVAGNTVVIYTSDNGFMCGSHGYGSKVLPYEESARVPLIIYDPRAASGAGAAADERQGRRRDALTSSVDFAPTMLRLAGLEPPHGLDGRDLMPLYEDPDAKSHDVLPLINVWGPEAVFSLGLVTRDAKYIYWPYEDEGFEATEELFDTAADPFELRQLAKDSKQGELLASMRKQYDLMVGRWRAECVPYHGYPKFGDVFDRTIPWRGK